MLEPTGTKVPVEDLALAKARDLASYLTSGINPDAFFVEARHDSTGHETIVLEVRVGVSQLSKHPILPLERIAVSFAPDDNRLPEVVSLREDFPAVPHLNLREKEFPRSLCLWEASYDELKLRWTSALLVERLGEWLLATSKGELHLPGQPLEPVIGGALLPIIVGPDFIKTVVEQQDNPRPYVVRAIVDSGGVPSAFLLSPSDAGKGESQHRVTLLIAQKRVHERLREAPSNLKELIALCESEGLELRDALRQELQKWRDDISALRSHLAVVVLFPKQRSEDGAIETWDTFAFFLNGSLEQIGISLGLWERTPTGTLGLLLGPYLERGLDEISVSVLNPLFGLTREQAARYNGTQTNDGRFAIIGVGALGSILINLLVRKGFGFWSILDKDTFLPHNGARHVLPGAAAGYSKAQALRSVLEVSYFEPTTTAAHVVDILHPGDTNLAELLECVEAIIDCSADVPVARYLARDAPSNARRVSIFLNPTGEDLVMLAEDSNRGTRLDVLEMQYYGLLLDTPQLQSHLTASVSRVRYGRSCRDLSLILSVDAVSRNASIGSRALPDVLSSSSAFIGVWKGELDGSVTCYGRQIAPWYELGVEGNRIVWEQRLVDRLRDLRAKKLPKETGGALFGQWDHSRRILYMIGATGAPRDSKEEPTGFIRGAHAELRDELNRAKELTGGSAQYVGEWHSHPDGCDTRPSKDWDRNLLPYIQRWLALDGAPPLMLIVGQKDMRFVMAEYGDGVSWNFPS